MKNFGWSVRSVAMATALFAAAGCNAPLEREHDAGKLSYPAARAYDFMDMFEVNLAGGVGLHAAAEITPIRVSYGYFDVTKMGTMGRSFGIWDELRKEFFFIHSFMYWQKQPCFGNRYMFDPDELHRINSSRNEDDHSRYRFYETWGWTTRYEDWERPWLDLVLEAHLLFVGAELGFSLQECADFALGIICVDTVSHDDWNPTPSPDEPVSIIGQGAPPTFRPPANSPSPIPKKN